MVTHLSPVVLVQNVRAHNIQIETGNLENFVSNYLLFIYFILQTTIVVFWFVK